MIVFPFTEREMAASGVSRSLSLKATGAEGAPPDPQSATSLFEPGPRSTFALKREPLTCTGLVAGLPLIWSERLLHLVVPVTFSLHDQISPPRVVITAAGSGVEDGAADFGLELLVHADIRHATSALANRRALPRLIRWDQPFELETEIPRMNCFWKIANTMIIGMVASTDPAITRFQTVRFC
jgi:hypothetical protein